MDIWMEILLIIGITIVGVPMIYGVVEGLIDGFCERRYMNKEQQHVRYHMRTNGCRNIKYRIINR